MIYNLGKNNKTKAILALIENVKLIVKALFTALKYNTTNAPQTTKVQYLNVFLYNFLLCHMSFMISRFINNNISIYTISTFYEIKFKCILLQKTYLLF